MGSGQFQKHSSCAKCDSSDAVAVYLEDDGRLSGYCFSCSTNYYNYEEGEKPKEDYVQVEPESVIPVSGLPYGTAAKRKISKKVAEMFGVRSSYDSNGQVDIVYYPYHKDREELGSKVRNMPKTFRFQGDMGDQLFGQQNFSAGGKRLIITEGEEDTLAIAESYEQKGFIYPVVSLASASNMKAPLAQREWLRSFDEICLWMDADKAGEEAILKLAKICGYDKVKIVKGKEKDASDEYTKHGYMEVNRAIWNAQPYNPAGIMSGESIWEAYRDKKEIPTIPYPPCLAVVQDKLKGIRQGEITLFTSGTSIGKSSIIKETVLHILDTTEEKVGMISLEESVGYTAGKFIGMHLKKDMTTGDTTEEEERKAFDEVFGDGRLILLDHQGAVSDGSLVDKIEYLALMGCKYLILDHLTIAVSEGVEKLTGNEATDKMMNELLRICNKHHVWIGLISHLRKTGLQGKSFEEGKMPSLDDIKGSGSVKQVSFDIIGFSRDLTSDDPVKRSTVHFSVLKNRFSGVTGSAGAASYDINTGRLTSIDVIAEDF